jgi:hypothetical protein
MWSKWPPGFTLSETPDFSQHFPRLQPRCCTDELSRADNSYNCIAWAASSTSAWWEPDPFFQYYWPEAAPRDYTLDAYIAAFRSKGFEVCANGSLEAGTEKIVIYTLQGQPRHAARQLPNGNWTSKMGGYEDIQHIELSSIGGPFYGDANVYMARKPA